MKPTFVNALWRMSVHANMLLVLHYSTPHPGFEWVHSLFTAIAWPFACIWGFCVLLIGAGYVFTGRNILAEERS